VQNGMATQSHDCAAKQTLQQIALGRGADAQCSLLGAAQLALKEEGWLLRPV
jgi:hypothetical protein